LQKEQEERIVQELREKEQKLREEKERQEAEF
jgi:hypothetical protein